MNRRVIGVIGHVDHGKSALVKALTGVETDRLAEEKARGISIALGFAHMAADGAPIDLIDMPGHERFVRTMIGGATGLGAVLLVVAANEGVMAQTREHVAIAALLGLSRAVVAVSKADLATPEEVEAVGAEARAVLAEAGLAAAASHATSARDCRGVEALRESLGRLAMETATGFEEGVAFLPVDRAFVVEGFGPVVTGTLRGGRLRVDEALELWPSRRLTRVRGLQVHGGGVGEAAPGQRVAVNLRGLEIGDLGRGMALAAPLALEPSEWLTLAIRSLPGGPMLANGTAIRWLAGTSEGEGRLRLLEGAQLGPGEAAFAQLRLAEAQAFPAGESVILRMPLPVGTVAGGRIVEPMVQRRRRGDGPMLARLAELRDGPVERVIAGETARAGAMGAKLADLARVTGLAPGRVAARLGDLGLVTTGRGRVLATAEIERRKLLAGLAATLGPAQAKAANQLSAKLAEVLWTGGLTPPTPRELVVDAQARHALDLLLRKGVALRCIDRAKDKEIIFHRDAVEAAKRALTPLLGGEGLLVSEICAALAISRKFAIPLLNHLDAVRFTRKLGDRRSLV